MDVLESNLVDHLESTCFIWESVDDSENKYFSPTKPIPGEGEVNVMLFENLSDDMDGVFPLPLHYINFIKAMEEEGTAKYLNWMGKKNKLEINHGYCTIIRESKHETKATLKFKEPIKVQMGELNDNPIIVEVNRIEGEFTHCFLWKKSDKLSKYANIIEIYFCCHKYFLD